MPPDQTPPPPAPEAVAPPTPWGFWATVGWSVVIAVAYVLSQTVAAGMFMFSRGMESLRGENLQTLMANGKLIALATLVSAPVVVGTCAAAAWMKKGISVNEYLALRWPPPRVAAKWFGAFVVFLIAVDVALSFLKGGTTEQFMAQVLKTAGAAAPFLYVALFLGAPISEEFFFRGFLFAGLKNSWMGVPGAIIVPTLLFAAIHLQYDLQGFLFVLLAGLFLGVTRAKTGSLWLCVALHAFMNFVATLAHSYLGGD